MNCIKPESLKFIALDGDVDELVGIVKDRMQQDPFGALQFWQDKGLRVLGISIEIMKYIQEHRNDFKDFAGNISDINKCLQIGTFVSLYFDSRISSSDKDGKKLKEKLQEYLVETYGSIESPLFNQLASRQLSGIKAESERQHGYYVANIIEPINSILGDCNLPEMSFQRDLSW